MSAERAAAQQPRAVRLRRMALFVLLTAAFSTPFWWLHQRTGYGAYVALLMWCPGLAAVVTLKAGGASLSELAWRGGQLRWVAFGWGVTVVGLIAAYAAAVALGKATFPDTAFTERMARAMGLAGAPVPWVLLAAAALAAAVGPINACGRALGEELGWRGLLVPEACGAFGFLPGALLSGVVWALWHVPLLWGKVSAAGCVNFLVLVVGIGVAYAWLRMRSGSIWPSTVMHGTHNAFRDLFLNPLTVAAPGAGLWLDEGGYTLAALGVCLALVFAALPLPAPKD